MGLYYSKQKEDGSVLAIWEILESEEELLQLCAIPNEEMEELQFIGNEKRRKERLAVRALLNQIFGKKVYLGYHENGRPFLQNSIIELSISHTHRFAAVLTHPEKSVGIDIESLDRNFSAVEHKALSEAEMEYLSEKQRALQLAIIWSAKEALYKRMSQNDVNFSRQMTIEKFSPKEKGTLTAHFFQKDGEDLEFEMRYKIIDDHILVWVVE